MRRTREYLETTPDPQTGEPLLRPVSPTLHRFALADFTIDGRLPLPAG